MRMSMTGIGSNVVKNKSKTTTIKVIFLVIR